MDLTNSTAALRITKIEQTVNDVRMTWTPMGGRSHVLQTNAASTGAGVADRSSALFVLWGGEERQTGRTRPA